MFNPKKCDSNEIQWFPAQAALPTFKIKIMGSETQNYRISRKIIVHKLLVHILPADGASLLQI